MHRFLLALGATIVVQAAVAQTAPAPVTVSKAWARASVQGQSGTGAFMTLVAREALTLESVSTPVAGVAELHEMAMQGDVMRMRPVAGIALVPGQPVDLKPGGYHVMMMDLKMPLKPDSSVPLTLQFRSAAGARTTLQVQVPVAIRPPTDAAGPHKH